MAPVLQTSGLHTHPLGTQQLVIKAEIQDVEDESITAEEEVLELWQCSLHTTVIIRLSSPLINHVFIPRRCTWVQDWYMAHAFFRLWPISIKEGMKQSDGASRLTGYFATLHEPRGFQFYKAAEMNVAYVKILLPSVRKEENHGISLGEWVPGVEFQPRMSWIDWPGRTS
jgi:hypothetical protein